MLYRASRRAACDVDSERYCLRCHLRSSRRGTTAGRVEAKLMKYDSTNRLASHVNSILTGCSRADVIEIMRLSRLVIEQRNVAHQYPVLSLYCDWAQHTEIDRHPGAFAMLARIDGVLVVYAHHDPSIVIHEISKAFALAQLREEFVKLFLVSGANTLLFDSLSNWCQFVGILLNDLADRPVRFPKGIESKSKKSQVRAIFDGMVKRRATAGQRADLVTKSLSIDNHSDETDPRRPPPGFYWQIRSLEQSPEHYMELTGQMQLTEGREQFRLD